MSAPRVSVITPVYNGARYLDESVQSALGQSFRDWELLLIDDGSTDGSPALLDGYAARHPDRVRALHHPGRANKGQFGTRVFGAGEARGEVVALLDQDDVWDPDYLEKHLRVWDASPGLVFSYGPGLYWYPEEPARDYVQPMPPGVPRVCAPGELLGSFLAAGYANTPCPSCTLIRREALAGAGRFAGLARRSAFEDQYLWWSASARGPVAVHDQAWVRYRQHSTSAVNFLAGTPRRVQRTELDLLRALRRDLAGCLPGHPLLTGGQLAGRAAALRRALWADTLRAGPRRVRSALRRLAERFLGRPHPSTEQTSE